MSPPLFSIVTVTLNCAHEAERTARGVLAQEFDDFEYVVKDGESTDGTVERLRQLGLNPIIRPDSGIYSAMNQALSACTGSYVCFMNAGDQFAGPQVLKRVAAFIRANDTPEFVYGDVATYRPHPELEGGAIPARPREIQYADRLSRFLLYRRMICHQAWFLRLDCYRALGGFDQRYQLLADYDLLLKVCERREVRAAHLPFVTAVFQGGGLSEQRVDLADRERAEVLATRFRITERLVYAAAYHGTRWIVRKVIYRVLYPFLSPALRRKLFGS